MALSDNIIPSQAGTDLPTFRFLVDGEEISGEIGVASVFVSKAANKISVARMVVFDGDASSRNFTVSSGNTFTPGREIEIKAGYHNLDETVFRGIIVKHALKSRSSASSVLEIEMKDAAVKMTLGRKNKYFEELRDSEIIEEIIGEYGIDLEIDDTPVSHKEMVQYYCTDWDFVLSRAEVNGRLVFVEDGKLVIKIPEQTSEPVLELTYGANIIEFEAEMDARDQYKSINSRSWDYSGQELIEEESEEPGFSGPGNISVDDLGEVIGLEKFIQQHTGRLPEQELKAWSDAKLLRSRLAKIRGRVRINGTSSVKPGDLVELAGLGERFNGTAFVSAVSHQYSNRISWVTDIEFGLSQEWFAHRYEDITEKPASALLPAIQGLQIGIVTNIHEDPDGEDRIRVRIPVIDTDDKGVWARLATLDAGSERGSVFRPEVDDEVVVGFLNDDPRNPVILGMLHSSAKPAPIRPEEENNEKGFVSRNSHKIVFNDDKNSITLETSGGNKILLEDGTGISMTDEHGNSIEMNSNGIFISSNKKLEHTAVVDLKIEGKGVEISSTGSLKLDGASGAELSSSASTVVKGAIVQIN